MDVMNDSLVRMTTIETIMKLINEAKRTSEPIMVRGEAIRIIGISNQLQELYTGMENYQVPFDKVIKTLEAIIVTFKRKNIKAEELEKSIKQSYHDLVNMGIKYASEDAIVRNREVSDHFTIEELRRKYKEISRECATSLRYAEVPERKRVQLQNFNYSFLIYSYKKIMFYPHYFDYNLRTLIQETESMISTCSTERRKKMLVEIHRQLQVLLSKGDNYLFIAPCMVTEIESIRAHMHQEYPLNTLLCKEYQYIYTKLLEIAKQIACEFIVMSKKAPNGLRTPLLKITNTKIQPLDIYSYIEKELSLLGGVLTAISDKANPEDKEQFDPKEKEKAAYILTELQKLEGKLLPYETFKKNLRNFLLAVKSIEFFISSDLLKGIIACIYEFAEKIERIEIERTAGFLTNKPEDSNDNYDSLNAIMEVKKEEAASKERALFEQSLGKETKYTFKDVNIAWSEVMHLQIIIYGIKSYANINKIELEPGRIKQSITPEG